MSAQIRSIALAAPLLVWGASLGVSATAAPAGKCLTAPNRPAPKGQHWYYHTDRKTGRKCWFLRELKAPQQHAAQSGQATTIPAAKAATSEKPAAASAATPRSISAAHRASSPPAKAESALEPTPASSATPSEPAPQDDQAKNAAPSFPLAPPASDIQASEWADAPAPAAQPTVPIIWPDPRPVETIKIRKANPSQGNVASDPSQPTDAVHAAPESKSTPRSAAPSTAPSAAPAKPVQSAQLISSTAVTPVQMALVVLSALAVAGLLYHLVIRIAASRRRRDALAYTPPVWADDRPQRVRRNEPRPQAPVQELQRPVAVREQFVDDAHVSLVPGASEESVHRPPRETDVHRAFAPRKAAVAPAPGAISEHENNLAQLIRDLDQLLQTRKGA